jgi:hypothetical protein
VVQEYHKVATERPLSTAERTGARGRGSRRREEHRAEVACARNEIEINANLREEPGHKAPKERERIHGERAHGEILAKGERTDGRTKRSQRRRGRRTTEGNGERVVAAAAERAERERERRAGGRRGSCETAGERWPAD